MTIRQLLITESTIIQYASTTRVWSFEGVIRFAVKWLNYYQFNFLMSFCSRDLIIMVVSKTPVSFPDPVKFDQVHFFIWPLLQTTRIRGMWWWLYAFGLVGTIEFLIPQVSPLLRSLVHQNSPQPLSVDLLPAINVGLELSVVRGRDQNKAFRMDGGRGRTRCHQSISGNSLPHHIALPDATRPMTRSTSINEGSVIYRQKTNSTYACSRNRHSRVVAIIKQYIMYRRQHYTPKERKEAQGSDNFASEPRSEAHTHKRKNPFAARPV